MHERLGARVVPRRAALDQVAGQRERRPGEPDQRGAAQLAGPASGRPGRRTRPGPGRARGSAATSAPVRTGAATTGPTPATMSRSTPAALSGTMMSREQDRRVHPVPAYRLEGDLGDQVRPGAGVEHADPGPHARYSGSDRPAWRMNQTGVRSTGSRRIARTSRDVVAATRRAHHGSSCHGPRANPAAPDRDVTGRMGRRSGLPTATRRASSTAARSRRATVAVRTRRPRSPDVPRRSDAHADEAHATRHCPCCGDERAFETPPCPDGHGPDCAELACRDCGAALLVDPYLAAASAGAPADPPRARRGGLTGPAVRCRRPCPSAACPGPGGGRWPRPSSPRRCAAWRSRGCATRSGSRRSGRRRSWPRGRTRSR